ncbi:MAG: group 1 truncated hemoglobin [Pseudobdellovibrionaceae bacterium]|uniref:group I truncated hemoglobin n=1 Tax=Oligoflexus sp. TaxID=1971216 RepID=UPI0027C858CC|nr:group 1 truncated hemoglobin [Oligoflexus sp.]MDQ3234936.1 group 1 truncated hemoglobin [Pseudobdellovibrionaceae bacterium]HYX32507.1 group 1 truncated hemoglobin [Oligoflexus sp.]
MTLYDDIGAERLRAIVLTFYNKVFQDPMLAHFFMNLDHESLVQMQVDFVTGMLGGPQGYRGKPLEQIHDTMLIRPPHFRRRQRILQETMVEYGLDARVIDGWLKQEERLKPLIMKDQTSCVE